MRTLLSVLVLLPAFAFAQRVAPVFAGPPTAARASAELALLAGLKTAGLVPIDASQSRVARAVDDLGRLIDGGPAPVITDLDADVLLAARLSTTPVTSALLGPDVTRVDVSIEVKMIAVDTGEVRLATQVTAPGIGFGPAPATQKGATAAVAKLMPAISKALKSSPTARIQLAVEGCPNLTACAGITGALRGIDGVESAEAQRGRRGLSRWTITGAITARALALALDAQPGLGLDVHGHGPATVFANHAPRRLVQIPVLVPARIGRGASGGLLADVIATALQATGPAKVIRAGQPKITVSGRTRRDGARVYVTVQARHGDRVLAALQVSCARGELAACLVPEAQRWATRLEGAILADRTLTGDLPPPPTSTAARALVIDAVHLDTLLPAHAGKLATAPAGRVSVHNRGKATLRDLVVQARLAGFAAPVDTRLAALPPGESAEIPVRLALDTARLARHDANTSASLEVVIEYREGERSSTVRRRHPLVIYDRNAMRWSAPAALAAFVDARNPAVASRARAFAAAAPAGDPLGVPAALHAALRGVRYVADPVHPMRAETLDFVQYPAQTLAHGAGDCDDLTVLYAALAEVVGRRTLLLILPGHALVAVESGWPRQARMHLAVDADQVIEYDGALFIPLETTDRDADFATAWRKGAAALRGAKVVRVDTRQAWEAWPAIDLSGTVDVPAPRIDADAIKRALDGARAAYRAAAEAQLAAAQSPTERGALLVALGRMDAARAALADAKGAAGINNRGNLAFTAGDVQAARQAYDRAATAAPTEPRIHLNAALAAHAAGDADAFAAHVIACLDHGGSDLVEALARAGLAGTGPGLSAALKKAGRATFDPGTVAQRADAPRAHRFVYWL